MALLLGVDTGGTYTDAVLIRDEREVVASGRREDYSRRGDSWRRDECCHMAARAWSSRSIQLPKMFSRRRRRTSPLVAGFVHGRPPPSVPIHLKRPGPGT